MASGATGYKASLRRESLRTRTKRLSGLRKGSSDHGRTYDNSPHPFACLAVVLFPDQSGNNKRPILFNHVDAGTRVGRVGGVEVFERRGRLKPGDPLGSVAISVNLE